MQQVPSREGESSNLVTTQHLTKRYGASLLAYIAVFVAVSCVLLRERDVT